MRNIVFLTTDEAKPANIKLLPKGKKKKSGLIQQKAGVWGGHSTTETHPLREKENSGSEKQHHTKKGEMCRSTDICRFLLILRRVSEAGRKSVENGTAFAQPGCKEKQILRNPEW
jgi:hypothetical protein